MLFYQQSSCVELLIYFKFHETALESYEITSHRAKGRIRIKISLLSRSVCITCLKHVIFEKLGKEIKFVLSGIKNRYS